jgi:hypothetical protein
VYFQERARGASKASTYVAYLNAAGGLTFSGVVLCVMVAYVSFNPVQSIALAHVKILYLVRIIFLIN